MHVMEARFKIWSLITDRHSWQLVATWLTHPANACGGEGVTAGERSEGTRRVPSPHTFSQRGSA